MVQTNTRLNNQEIKEHILSEEDKSIDDTVKAIEAEESGKIARKAVGVTTSSARASLVGKSWLVVADRFSGWVSAFDYL